VKFELECWDCEKKFEFDHGIDIYTSCDIIGGQYTEFMAVRCPFCGIESRW